MYRSFTALGLVAYGLFLSSNFDSCAGQNNTDTAPDTSVQLFPADAFPDFAMACSAALAATINCTSALLAEAYTFSQLNDTDIENLCVDTCTQSMRSYRSAIVSACGDAVYYDPIAGYNLTAVSLVDSFFSGYSSYCTKNSAGQFCYSLLRPAPQYTTETAADAVALLKVRGLHGGNHGHYPHMHHARGLSHMVAKRQSNDSDCSECSLKMLQARLNDPWGYNADDAAIFTSLTSSCGVSTLTVTATPTSVFVNSTSVAPTATPTCTGVTIAVSSSDTCDTIAETHHASTWHILFRNNLDAGCINFPTSGSLCIEETCTTYVPTSNDTCRDLAKTYNVTVPQLVSWNPDIDPACANFNQTLGHHICLTNPLPYDPGNITNPASPTTATTDAPLPTDAAPNSTVHCGRWYEVQDGDYCALITTKNQISLADFYFLNPMLDANCTNLWNATSYCVLPVGDISTYPGYAGTTTLAPIATSSFINYQDLPTATRPVVTLDPTPFAYPLANNSRKDCTTYYDNDQGNQSCVFLSLHYDVSLFEIVLWNQDLGNATALSETAFEPCSLTNETRYCAQLYDPTEYAVPDTGPIYADVPSNAATNSTTECFLWYEVGTGDNCTSILSVYEIAFAAFYAWNPSVHADCSNLWQNTSYCVYGPGFDDNGGDNNSTTTTTSAAPSSTSVAAPGPTQSGIPANCDKYVMQQDGVYCADMATNANITLNELYGWNPALNGDCSGLWAGYAYCVGVSSDTSPSSTTTLPTTTTTTATSPSITPPGPTQSGIPANCDEYVMQKDGVYCGDMATNANITLNELYGWNPALNGDCSGLWAGYAYCVGVSGDTSLSSTTTLPSTTTTPSPTTTLPTTTTTTATSPSVTPPGPAQSGIPANCDAYVMQKDGVYCADMAANAGITLAELYGWNPALNGDCSGLWAGYAYCVGVSSS
ncbi:hypothetical protein FN846DRAFT_818519 [Sphaerosporella brunnea]|uniref:LysM domain-containing protein n=1 Tax=Sphaerosporella brunnea TaxID=1250544 RepID=A0A5J5EJS6_9PEZI|nr:hypothetical protein FN846DRAFT_818519 [Sphaerosporella brunnea]